MGIFYTQHKYGGNLYTARTSENAVAKYFQERSGKTLAAPERQESLGPNRLHYLRHVGKRYIRVTCAIERQKCIVISVVDKGD